VEYAEKIYLGRINGLAYLTKVVQKNKAYFFDDQIGLLDIGYKAYGTQKTIEHGGYKLFLEKVLEEKYEKEVWLGYAIVGPHRDDYLLTIDQKELLSFYSRGIRKTMALLLNYCMLLAIEEKKRNFPILLLDDSLAELDVEYKDRIIKLLADKTQLIYATVHQEDKKLFNDVLVYKMQKGGLFGE
jgi:DNA replication and repair protein RecF